MLSRSQLAFACQPVLKNSLKNWCSDFLRLFFLISDKKSLKNVKMNKKVENNKQSILATESWSKYTTICKHFPIRNSRKFFLFQRTCSGLVGTLGTNAYVSIPTPPFPASMGPNIDTACGMFFNAVTGATANGVVMCKYFLIDKYDIMYQVSNVHGSGLHLI